MTGKELKDVEEVVDPEAEEEEGDDMDVEEVE